MDFWNLVTRYRQFGGVKLTYEYVRIGAMRPANKAGFQCMIKRQSLKSICKDILREVEPFLIKRYAPLVSRYKIYALSRLVHQRSKIIWFCWLQGLEQAPSIVKACYNSLVLNLTDREIKGIDNKNWKEFFELPEYIVDKWEKKRIPVALFSDLLRLELLIKYGGTWIDSTVLCTGFNSPKIQEFKDYFDAGLFLFQYTSQGSIPVSISNCLSLHVRTTRF